MSCYRLSYPSRIENADSLRRWFAFLEQSECYSGRFSQALELTVHEAFVNAVMHGNHYDPELPVVLSFKTGGRLLDVRIRDFGGGFFFEHYLAVACSEQARSQAGGRGLLLMRHYADQLSVERLPDGCVVVLRYIPY